MYYNNAYYARVGGISNGEVNSLEMEMLRMISFSLFVQPEQYERYRASLYQATPTRATHLTLAHSTHPGSLHSLRPRAYLHHRARRRWGAAVTTARPGRST